MSLSDSVKSFLSSEGRVVIGAPVSFTAAVIVVASLIWFGMDWRYGGIIANRDSEISTLKTQIDGYKNVFNGAAPEQVLQKITSLQNQISAFLPPRRLSDNARKNFIEGLRPLMPKLKGLIVYADASSESRRYAGDFLSALRDIGAEPSGPISVSFNFGEVQTGLMVGLADPDHPSEDVKKFFEMLKTIDRDVRTTKWGDPPEGHSRDFDLFIGPQ